MTLSSLLLSGTIETLVRVGEERAHLSLPPHLRAFLVTCLEKHLRDKNITHQTFALGFLGATELVGSAGIDLLRRVGDGALIVGGFFPERARRLNVHENYFRMMGEAAYTTIATRLFSRGMSDSGTLFNAAAESVAAFLKVLDAARKDDWDAFVRSQSRLH